MAATSIGSTRLTTLWRRACDDRGQSLVEFALASIVFFMTIFGILELGIAVSRYNMIADLAQEGARWASVRGQTADNAALQAFVDSRASGMSTVATMSPATPITAGNPVTVTVTSSYSPMTAFVAQTVQIPLSSSATMYISR